MTNKTTGKFRVIRKWAEAKGFEVKESNYFEQIEVVTPFGRYQFENQESTVFTSVRGTKQGNAKGLYMAKWNEDRYRFGYAFQEPSQKKCVEKMEEDFATWEKEMASKEETIEEVSYEAEVEGEENLAGHFAKQCNEAIKVREANVAEYYQGEIIQDRKGMWNGEVRRSKDNFTVAIVSKPSKQACKNAIANEILRLETENVEKVKLSELRKMDWEEAVVVFTKESFGEIEYDLKDRSYQIHHTAKYFDPSKIGSSLFGNCLDGKDLGVRLDWYIHNGDWVVDYCYIIK